MIKIINSKYEKIKEDDAVVIIDVFRATSVMLYLFKKGVERIYPSNGMVKIHISNLYVGEMGGVKPKRFNFSNSPSEIICGNITHKEVVHLSSSGTRAFQIFKNKTKNIYVGSLLNSKVLSSFLKRKYKNIYLYPTNRKNIHKYNEDYICAKYIENLINDKKYDILNKIDILGSYKNNRFMKESLQDRFPKEDYYLCTSIDSINKILVYNGDCIVEVKDE